MNKKIFSNIGTQVVIAMIIGTIVGAYMGADAAIFAPLGAVFIHLIKMLVIPLVAVAIITGAANLGNSPAAGKIGISTFLFFILTSAAAVGLALLLGEVFKPGVGVNLVDMKFMFSNEYADKGDVPGFFATILGMIPTNIFKSLNNANILQILVFCLFLGIALSKVDRHKTAPLMSALSGLVDAFVWMINVVMRVAPIGVFGLMAEAVGTFGFDVLTMVMKLFLVYVLAILIFGFGFYPLLIKLFSNVSVFKFISAMKRPQVVALSTASSMATLPVTMNTS